MSIVKISTLRLNTEPECIICGGRPEIGYKRKKTGEKWYKLTCSKECTNELKSKNASKSRSTRSFLFGKKSN